VTVVLRYPDGTGSVAYAVTNPDAHGRFAYNTVPIGTHTLWIVFSPENDTVSYPVTVYPGRAVTLDIVFPADLW
jgi:hypothetical protein